MSVSPPRPKGPPLNALRAFESAARLGSFAAAAEELNVTPGAVSQHIKALEDWAGASLFRRKAQGVEITRAGREILPSLTKAFDEVGEAVRLMRGVRPRRGLAIAVLPSVGQLWLAPRLAGLRKALPDVAISVYAMEQPPNLLRNLFDMSLFIRAPSVAPREAVLEIDAMVPVCSPEIATRIRVPTDLFHETLLIDEVWAEDWPNWFESSGLAPPDLFDSPRYSLYSLALEDAKAGAGVLMGHRCLVAEALGEGTLVELFDINAQTGKALVLETPENPTAYVKTAAELLRNDL